MNASVSEKNEQALPVRSRKDSFLLKPFRLARRLHNRIWGKFRSLSHRIYPFSLVLRFNGKKKTLSVKASHFWEDRNIKTLALFLEAFEQVKPRLSRSFTMRIQCDDRTDYPGKVYAYSRTEGQDNVILIPDFLFIDWKECGIRDYEECRLALMEAAKKPPVHNTLFWIGNSSTHSSRKTLLEIGKTDPRMDINDMCWNWVDGKNTPTRFVSLVDHTRYKYLIDIQGSGWSARTKLLFFTGRPLFLVDRKHREYWYGEIKPFVHYIPVKEDLSDLKEMLDWAFAHEEEAQKIAENAMDFARSHLTRKSAAEYMEQVIIGAGEVKRK